MDACSNTWALRKVVATVLLPFATLGLVGCSTAGPEEGTTVQDVLEEEGPAEEPATDGLEQEIEDEESAYVGSYDEGFGEDYDSLVGEQVTVSAEVNEIVSPIAFTIAGTDNTTVDELLIIHSGEEPAVSPGMVVAVTGVVHEAFNLADSEEELGMDLDEDLYNDWNDLRYIEAFNIDTSVDTG